MDDAEELLQMYRGPILCNGHLINLLTCLKRDTFEFEFPLSFTVTRVTLLKSNSPCLLQIDPYKTEVYCRLLGAGNIPSWLPIGQQQRSIPTL